MTIQELIKKIEQWAIDRELDKNGTVEGQLIKTAEEVSELIIGMSKGNLLETVSYTHLTLPTICSV